MTLDPNTRLFPAIDADLTAHIPEDARGGSRLWRIGRKIAIAFRSSGLHLALLYRVSFALRAFGPIGRIFAAIPYWIGRHFYACSISPAAKIGGGLILPHPQGIVIGASVIIDDRAWIFQNVTIGGAPGKAGAPAIGPDARIYPGAVISGPITLGANVVIGANCVVTEDVSDRTVTRAAISEKLPLPDRMKAES